MGRKWHRCASHLLFEGRIGTEPDYAQLIEHQGRNYACHHGADLKCRTSANIEALEAGQQMPTP